MLHSTLQNKLPALQRESSSAGSRPSERSFALGFWIRGFRDRGLGSRVSKGKGEGGVPYPLRVLMIFVGSDNTGVHLSKEGDTRL